MAIVNRKTIRTELAALLSAALSGIGNPLQAFYGYLVGDFQGQSPVGMLTSAGSDRQIQVQGDDMLGNDFDFDLHILALYADPGTTWSEDDMENMIDDIEYQVAATVINANELNSDWYLSYRGASETTYLNIAGDRYRVETIPLRVEVTR